jgi:16S rRNA (guanine527-N7)-methyltransferase
MREAIVMALPGLTEAQIERFCRYSSLLLDWNSRVNLTAIKEPAEIAQKHFADSLLPIQKIPQGAKVIDVGTGAGFPGIPLKIMRPDIKLTLLDSLAKRVRFLEAVCAELELEAICIHARAEDAAHLPELRAAYDLALARAVAPCATLAELTLPFLRVGGEALLYKGPQAAAELLAAQNACKRLGCAATLQEYPAPWGVRAVIALKKTAPTPKAYPRKAGTPAKQPL